MALCLFLWWFICFCFSDESSSKRVPPAIQCFLGKYVIHNFFTSFAFFKKEKGDLVTKIKFFIVFFSFSFLMSNCVKPFKYHCGHHINFILILFLFVSNIPLLLKKSAKYRLDHRSTTFLGMSVILKIALDIC